MNEIWHHHPTSFHPKNVIYDSWIKNVLKEKMEEGISK